MYDPSDVWMLTNGSAKTGVGELQPRLLSPFDSVPPPSGPATQTHTFTINQTGIVTWVVDRAPYTEPKVPIIQGNVSDGWQANTTIHVPSNSTIDIIMRIANDSMDTVSSSRRSSIPLLRLWNRKLTLAIDGAPYASTWP